MTRRNTAGIQEYGGIRGHHTYGGMGEYGDTIPINTN